MEQREVVHDKVHYFKSGLTTLSEKKTALGVGFAKSSLHAEQESSSWEVSQSPRSASSGLLFVGCGFVLHSRSSFPQRPLVVAQGVKPELLGDQMLCRTE